MLKTHFFLFFFLFSVLSLSSQNIKGKVTQNGLPIEAASILIKSLDNPKSILNYQITNEKGNYILTLKNSLREFVIEVNAYGYETQVKTINLNDKTVEVNFELQAKANQLDEIIINRAINAVQVKNDTTVYDVTGFRNGTEKVVEDILKKLPGVKVEDNGEIKFKGKAIKKMMLDGDDLFDNLYVTGSRNLNIDLIEKVEAIENYNENPLLKGLKDSENVALNLKLKKGLTDVSGNANLSYGYIDKYNIAINGIVVNDKLKSFGLVNSNNVGINNTPYDFQSTINSSDQLAEKDLIAKKTISESLFSPDLDTRYCLNNRSFFSSLNVLFKIMKKVSLKSNINYYSDKMISNSNEQNYFSQGSNNFTNFRDSKVTKSPNLINANFHLINNSKPNFNWEYQGKLNWQNMDYTNVSLNNSLLQYNKVNSTSFFTKQNINLTERINENNAITASIIFSKSNSPQDFVVTPGIKIDPNTNQNSKLNSQTANFLKEVMDCKVEYITKFNVFKWLIRMGNNTTKNDFKSYLYTINESNGVFSNVDFQNKLNYHYNITYFDQTLVYNKNEFSFKLSLGSQYYTVSIHDGILGITETKNDLILTPMVKLLYRFSLKSNCIASYSFNQLLPDEMNLFKGVVESSFRDFQSNEPSFHFLKTHNFGTTYNYVDLFNLTNFSVNFNYFKRQNNYFLNTIVNAESTISQSFLTDVGSNGFTLNTIAEKYLNFLKTTFAVNIGCSISNDKNKVNDSEFRDIQSRTFFFELKSRSGRKAKLAIENKIAYMNSIFLVEGEEANTFSNLKDNLKTRYKIKEEFNLSATLNFIRPDLKQNKNYFFLDSEISLYSKNKKIEYTIQGTNLTNNKTFEIISISDYSKAITFYKLNERCILASIAFKF